MAVKHFNNEAGVNQEIPARQIIPRFPRILASVNAASRSMLQN